MVGRFDEELLQNGYSPLTRGNYARAIKILDRHIGKPYREIDADDIRRLGLAMAQDLAPSSQRVIKTWIARFLAWVHGMEDGYPECVRAWKSRRNNKARNREADKLPKAIPLDLLKKMIETAGNDRDRAFFATLFESGARIQEFLNVRIKDINPISEKKWMMKIPFDPARPGEGLKTGERVVPLYECIPLLREWFACHPRRTDPEAALWLSKLGGQLSYDGAKKIVRTSLNRLLRQGEKIPSGVSPHSFRHARALRWKRENEGSEEVMRRFFGWAGGSTMPSR